ncbi:MAG TPA: alpha/beta hydrolase-fold protein [Streptosporangiaceae bacterium]|nr:alpha/beta hydrolase-fold protein [Streptosporangiaceae bacterium]
MLEPQSTLFFVLLVLVFGALTWCLAVSRHMAFRILAACLAFIPAMVFGVAAVNKHYNYYQNWSSAIADLTNQNLSVPVLPYVPDHSRVRFSTFLGISSRGSSAEQVGLALQLIVHGPITNITRDLDVYLPPQYFRAAYRRYRFPVIELIHGFPGVPQDWITVLGVDVMLRSLIGAGLAKPAVLVMPDASGGRGISLQCLNQVRGPQDATYLARELPGYISRVLRVAPPGPAWGIAGYSEGGFCAANLGLQYPRSFGFSGVLSGYFKPSPNQLGHVSVSPFGGSLRLQRANTPDYEVASLPAGTPIPRFWIGVGTADRGGLGDAGIFCQILRHLQPGVTLRLVPGGHTASTWRALLPPMLHWMTRGLAGKAARGRGPRLAAARRAAAAPGGVRGW